MDKCTDTRASQLASIDSAFEYFQAGGNLESSCEEHKMVNQQLLSLLEEMKKYGGGKEPDLEIVSAQNDLCFKVW